MDFLINICKWCITEYIGYESLKLDENTGVSQLLKRELFEIGFYNSLLQRFCENTPSLLLNNDIFTYYYLSNKISELNYEESSNREYFSEMMMSAEVKCNELIRQVKKFIDECYGDEFHLNQVARVAGMLE